MRSQYSSWQTLTGTRNRGTPFLRSSHAANRIGEWIKLELILQLSKKWCWSDVRLAALWRTRVSWHEFYRWTTFKSKIQFDALFDINSWLMDSWGLNFKDQKILTLNAIEKKRCRVFAFWGVAMTQLVFFFHPELSFFLSSTTLSIYLFQCSVDLSLRLTDFFATYSNHPLLMSPAPFFSKPNFTSQASFSTLCRVNFYFFFRVPTLMNSRVVLTRL